MYKYQDPACSVEERVEDLMARMTFEQKVDQITCLVTISDQIPDFRQYIPHGIGNVGAFTVAENARTVAEYAYKLQKYLVEETPLGIPALIHCEAAAGAQFTEADVFPSAIAQASSFQPENIREMSQIIRDQLYAVGFRQALSPVFDIARDPRWGRTTETYGEDPTLTSAMGSAFVNGLQWDGKEKKILATAKHFVGHGITEGGLNMARSMISQRDLEEVHCKPFQAAITEGGLASVMNSYCQWDGEPVACSKRLLTDLLRGKMDFKGFVVSDYISIDRLVDPFCVAETYEEAGEKALAAGLDVEYPRPKGYTYQLKEAVEQGRLSMETVDQAVRRVLTAKFEIGLFEHPYPDFEALEKSLHQTATDQLNLKMARDGIILLKNENHLLPLSEDTRRIAVVGPHADSVRSYFATFSYPAALDMSISREEDGQVFEEPGLIIYDIQQRYPGEVRQTTPRVEKRLRREFSHARTLAQAIGDLLPDACVTWAVGVDYSGHDISDFDHALTVAADADVVILTLGGKNGWGLTSTVGEGVDGTKIGLPGEQERFARAIRELGKPTVVVHFDGRPLSSTYVDSHFDAILEVWQPGIFGGQAIADTLFGRNNPAGRLPVTAARSVGQLPVYYGLPRGSGYVSAGHTGMIRNKMGYIDGSAYPLYYFGHGLSYTEFSYCDLKIKNHSIAPEECLEFSFKVRNTGAYDGDEVAQIYVRDKVSSVVRPALELVGFQRVSLAKGETVEIHVKLAPSQLAFIGKDHTWIIEEGAFELYVGASSNDLRLADQFEITQSREINPAKRAFYAEITTESRR